MPVAFLDQGEGETDKRYTARTIDWLAVYDRTSDRCYYVPAPMLGSGRDLIHLRLTPALNNQRRLIHFAEDFLTLDAPLNCELQWS